MNLISRILIGALFIAVCAVVWYLATLKNRGSGGCGGNCGHGRGCDPAHRSGPAGLRDFAGGQGLPQAFFQAVRNGYGRLQGIPLEFFEAEVFNFFQGFHMMYLNFRRACESNTRKVR